MCIPVLRREYGGSPVSPVQQLLDPGALSEHSPERKVAEYELL